MFLVPGLVAQLYTGSGFKAKLFSTKCFSNETPKEKHTDMTFAVAVRSIPKCIGSIKIDISKQNRSDQLFEFQTEGPL